jgi:hypothetical protein
VYGPEAHGRAHSENGTERLRIDQFEHLKIDWQFSDVQIGQSTIREFPPAQLRN